MDYFESKAPQVVYESLRELERAQEQERQRELAELNDWFVGGRELSRYLTQHGTEKPEQYKKRVERFVSLNYVTPLANQIIDGVYGPRVERTIECRTKTASKRMQEQFDWIWQLNSMHQKAVSVESLAVPLGSGFMRPYWDMEAEELRYALVRPENTLIATRGDDADRLQVLAECRKEKHFDNGRWEDVLRYFVWTPELYGELHVTEGGHAYFAEGEEMQPNEYGCIPYAHWKARSLPGQYYGLSLIRDAITIQKEVNNRNSALTVLVHMQGFSPFYVKGDCPDKLLVGEFDYLKLSKDADAGYLQPNAPIVEVQGSIDFLIEKMFESGGVPISAIRSGSANSGVQLAIEYKPLSDVVGKLKTQAIEAERELFEMSLKILDAHGQPVDLEAQLKPNFAESFLPTDSQQELANNLLKIQANLMSRAEFLQREDPDLTDKQVKEKLAAIDAEAAAGRQTRMGGGFGKPPSLFGSEEEEGEE